MHMLFAFACLLAVFTTASAQGASPGLTVVTSITTNATNGAVYPIGAYISLTVMFNDTVNVTNGADFAVDANTDIGGSNFDYSSGSGSNTLVFILVVTAQDDLMNLTFFKSGVDTNPFDFGADATVTDSFGLPTEISNSTFDPTVNATLDPFLNIAVRLDAVLPSILNLTLSTGTYALDSVIPLVVQFSEAVRLNGVAHIRFLGLDFVSTGVGADNTTINFQATVTESVGNPNLSNLAGLLSTTAPTITFDTANAITDIAGNALITTGVDLTGLLQTSIINAVTNVKALGTFVINATSGVTAIVGIYSDQSDIILTVGQTINIYVQFDRLVTLIAATPSVAATVTLTLNNGGVATLTAGVAASSTLVFTYTVKATDSPTLDLDVSGSNALSLGNLGLTDDVTGSVSAGSISLTTPFGSGTPAPGQNTTLARNNIQVETTGDVIISITSPNATGSDNIYLEGVELWINVTFQSDVTVSTSGGTPFITLSNGREATYNSGDSSSQSLIFVYTVTSDDTSDNQLAIANRNAINLNGGTINDQFGNAANLTIPAGISLNLGYYLNGNPDVLARIIVEFYDSHTCGSSGLQNDENSIAQIIQDNFNFTFLPYNETSCNGVNKRQNYVSDVTLEFDIIDFNGNEQDFFNNQDNAINAINKLSGVELISLEFSASPVVMPTLFGIALLFLSLLVRD